MALPPSIETHFFDTYADYSKVLRESSSAVIETTRGFVKLPYDYTNNNKYYLPSKPFDLEKQSGVIPSKAIARINMARKGIVTPFLKIGNNLMNGVSSSNQRVYEGTNMSAGSQVGIVQEDTSVQTKYNFKGKTFGDNTIPHVAFHHVDQANTRPSLNKLSKHFVNNIEFSNADYRSVEDRDGRSVVTTPKYQDAVAVYKKVSVPNNNASPLHRSKSLVSKAEEESDGKILSWDSKKNLFYWIDPETNSFESISNQNILPLTDPNLVGVASEIDPNTGLLWTLKTRSVPTENPPKTFKVEHQFVSWDGKDDFKEYGWWTSIEKADRLNYPARVISPNKLLIDNNNIHAMVELDPSEVMDKDEVAFNYYSKHADYQWFPFRKLYGESFNFSNSVKFAYFNPGLVATILSIPKNSDMKAKGTARFIRGAYHPTNTEYALYNDLDIEKFEGGNTSIFLGADGDELFFYQSFVPYNGITLRQEAKWSDPVWRQNNPDTSWNGLVAYNTGTGETRFIRKDVPFLVNTSGGIGNNQIILNGGIELTKQFVTSDNRIIGTSDNNPPSAEILYSYWIDNQAQNVSLSSRISAKDSITSPYFINLTDESITKESTEVDSGDNTSINERVNGAKMIVSPSGFSLVGGKNIQNRSAIRTRKKDKIVRVAVKWNGKLVDGQVARQIYKFSLGSEIEQRDNVTLKIKTKAEGAKLPIYPYSPKEVDYDIFRFSYSGAGSRGIDNEGDQRATAWTIISRGNNAEGEKEILIPGNDIIRDRYLMIMVETRRQTNKKKKLPVRLETEFIEVSVEKQGYIYEYEWNTLANGDQAALVLEASASGLPDQNGVEVYSTELSVLSSNV